MIVPLFEGVIGHVIKNMNKNRGALSLLRGSDSPMTDESEQVFHLICHLSRWFGT